MPSRSQSSQKHHRSKIGNPPANAKYIPPVSRSSATPLSSIADEQSSSAVTLSDDSNSQTEHFAIQNSHSSQGADTLVALAKGFDSESSLQPPYPSALYVPDNLDQRLNLDGRHAFSKWHLPEVLQAQHDFPSVVGYGHHDDCHHCHSKSNVRRAGPVDCRSHVSHITLNQPSAPAERVDIRPAGEYFSSEILHASSKILGSGSTGHPVVMEAWLKEPLKEAPYYNLSEGL